MFKDKIKKTWNSVGIFGIIAFLQYVAVVIFNFKYTKNAVDSDSAKLFRHAIEMSKNHYLWIPNYEYTTTMEWDSSAILAAPFYTLTHNIYISFAIANSIILLFFIFLVIRLFKQFDIAPKTICKSINFLLIPYAFGMLDYFNMLMFNGSQYIFRLIIPFLLMNIALINKEKRKGVVNIILCVLSAIIILIASISSGTYILVSCVLPIGLLILFDALMSDSFKVFDLYQYLICIIALVISGIGMVICIKVGGSALGTSMNLLRWYDFRYYADCFVEGYFRILGAMPGSIQDEEVAVMSLRGIAFLFKFLISILLIVSMIVALKNTFFTGRTRTSKNSVEQPLRRGDLRFFLYGIAFINLFILLVCETRYSSLNLTLEARYLLPVIVPSLLGIPLQLSIWKGAWSKYMEVAIDYLLVIAIIFTTAICYKDAHDSLDVYAYCDQIIDYVNNTDYQTVIFLNDRVTSECCRIKDIDREYEAYSSDGYMNIVDYYSDARHGYFYEPANLLFAIQGVDINETLGIDKASYYTYRDSIFWFDIYESSEFVLAE